MAGAGLIQLVAYGAQDVYLTGTPQITFFKVAYRRHTNFAMEAIEQTFTGVPDFGKKVTATVARNGDLITRAYLQVQLPEVEANLPGNMPVHPVRADFASDALYATALTTYQTALQTWHNSAPVANAGFSWIREIGHFLIKQVDIDIGGQRIDRHYGEWLSIWSSLTIPEGKRAGYDAMIGNVTALAGTMKTGPINNTVHAANSYTKKTPKYTLYIPLMFWFNRHPGLALPLIALQYHDVKINIEFRSLNECIRGSYKGSAPELGDTTLFMDYIYLDTDERRRFALAQHEYLIEQLQFTGDESISGGSSKIKMSFNHPVKELVWVAQSSVVTDVTPSLGNAMVGNNVLDWSNFTNRYAVGSNPILYTKLQLNGHDRFSERQGSYFNLVQPYQHHTNIPPPGINIYSFALNPEEHQPSGTLNFSRIDNATLMLTVDQVFSSAGARVKVFAHSYNVLRIMSGMGGLAFAS